MPLDTSIRVNKRVRAMVNTVAEVYRSQGHDVRANEAIQEMVRVMFPEVAALYDPEAHDSDEQPGATRAISPARHNR